MRKFVLVVVWMALAVVMISVPGQAETTFVVDRQDDSALAALCTSLPDDCSLRGATIAANTTPGADTITVPAGTYTLTIGGGFENAPAPATGDLDITEALTINGAGADSTIVDGGGATGLQDRIFHNHGGVSTTISGLTITGGSAQNSVGGGIFNNGGTLSVSNSTISGNTSDGGGGISIFSGTLTVERSTISGNTAPSGGGIYSQTVFNDFTSSKTTITNSTISGNTATQDQGGGGGGVRNTQGLTEIANSTITNNTAPDGQGSGVGVVGGEGRQTRVTSSIIAGNTNTDVYFELISTNGFVSGGYNLIGDGNATAAFDESTDRTGVTDPGLKPLALNAPGTTETHALEPTSPAVDEGPPPDQCPPPTTDQRGVSRPQEEACDIGSFELREQPSLSLRPSSRDYGERRVGTASPPRSFTLKNTGDVGLDVSGVNLQGADARDFTKTSDNCSGETLASAESCVIEVAFSPNSTGSKVARLVVQSNAPSSPDGARLTGEGTAVPPPPPEPEERCTITGTGGDDELEGTPRSDVICGLGGNDGIAGRGGDDILRGGPGDDGIQGGSGADELFGENGADGLNAVDDVRRNDAMNGGDGTDGCRGDRGDTEKGCEASQLGG